MLLHAEYTEIAIRVYATKIYPTGGQLIEIMKVLVLQALLGPLIIEIIDVEETEEYNLVIPFQH